MASEMPLIGPITAGNPSVTSDSTQPPASCALTQTLAAKLRESRTDLAERWLERITSRVTLPADRVFPTDKLLDHVPSLIGEIADYLENPADDVEGDTPVLAEAVQLGELRHRQGFDAYEILKEYEILGSILFHFLSEAANTLPQPCDPGELLVTSKHLFRALAIIQQTTMTHFLRRADERVAEREERLRAFNRMISHEIRNDIGAILSAADLLSTLDEDAAKRREFGSLIQRKARGMTKTVNNLAALSRLDGPDREHRHVRLPEAAAEAARQLRDAAAAAKVDVRIAEQLPDVEVNAPVVELALNNYLANAIKYARREGEEAYVEVSASEVETDAGREVIVRVADNGPGVPEQKRERLFQRFFRAHDGEERAVEGSGLGLSIVRETVESIGGRAWAEFPERGSAFCFAVPMPQSSAPSGVD